MINLDTLMAAQVEVTRFQAALDAVRAAERNRFSKARSKYLEDKIRDAPFPIPPEMGAYEGSPSTAALRRASMDLTRALAELRR